MTVNVPSARFFVGVPVLKTSSWHKLAEQENEVSTSSTASLSAFQIDIGASAYNKKQIIWVHIRDKAGKRPGYFYGSDVFFVNYFAENNQTTLLSAPAVVGMRYATSNNLFGYSSQYGIWGYSINSNGLLTVNKRYSESYSLTIDGTYVTTVYALDTPDGVNLFD